MRISGGADGRIGLQSGGKLAYWWFSTTLCSGAGIVAGVSIVVSVHTAGLAFVVSVITTLGSDWVGVAVGFVGSNARISWKCLSALLALSFF